MQFENLLPKSFVQDERGFWCSQSRSKISFPLDGHERNAAVEEKSFWFACRNRIITTLIRTKTSLPRSFIDVGGGTGIVSDAISKLGVPVLLVEPMENGCLRAVSRGTTTVVNATLNECSFPSHSFEAAGLFDVLEHLEEEGPLLQELKEILVPNGHLVVTVPALRRLWSNADVAAGHYRRYSLREICALLKKNGFEPIYATYFFSILVIPIILFRTLKRSKTNEMNTYHSSELVAPQFATRIFHFLTTLEIFFMKLNFPIPLGSSILIMGKCSALTDSSKIFGSSFEKV
jgi:SAM-dependent methyltransferase